MHNLFSPLSPTLTMYEELVLVQNTAELSLMQNWHGLLNPHLRYFLLEDKTGEKMGDREGRSREGG